MKSKNVIKPAISRRQLLKVMGVGAASISTGVASHVARAQSQGATDPKFLIVLAAQGGASLMDSFLAIRASEAGNNAASLNCFDDQLVTQVDGSPFRSVSLQGSIFDLPYSADQQSFVRKHHQNLMVVTQTGTSVNHAIAQKRSITGNDAWNGRTLQEAVAAQYGQDYLLANVNMASQGFLERGIDSSIPQFAYAEPISEATVWPLGLHGHKGVLNAPVKSKIDAARRLRNTVLDAQSPFAQTFQNSEKIRLWKAQREAQSALENQDLINKLNVLPHIDGVIPLRDYGLDESPDGAKVRQAFPNYLTDPLEAQAALAFLLLKNRVSVTVTISPSDSVLLRETNPPEVANLPLAFDYAHSDHRAAQAIMWNRVLGIADKLITLLSQEEYAAGQSFWDRSMIYMATDFGRDKVRPSNAQVWGTSHDLNNGYAIVSPMVNGGKILGGIDSSTGLTYGFDPEDPQGIPRPGTNMTEAQIYAGILHALSIDTSGSGLADMRAMRRNS